MKPSAALESHAKVAVDCGFHVHRELGPGLLESIYEIVLFESLRQPGLKVRRQVPISIQYSGQCFDNGYFLPKPG
ncbi:MAG TPA: GxxExxY protein [Novosphingobium sp.]|nr:GxxExxY protein [Novosphingobium sp.]